MIVFRCSVTCSPLVQLALATDFTGYHHCIFLQACVDYLLREQFSYGCQDDVHGQVFVCQDLAHPLLEVDFTVCCVAQPNRISGA